MLTAHPIPVLKTKTPAIPMVQAKLSVNQPGDVYEQEADAMAEHVISMQSSNHITKPVSGLIGASIQRKCAHCEEEEKKQKMLMRKESNGGVQPQVAPSLSAALSARKGGGHPIPQATRRFMENAFSTSFSGVRLHTDSQAAGLSNGIGAKAFTYGSDIYFNNGEFNPVSEQGKKLLAHELTHVLQQSPYTVRRKELPGFAPTYDASMARHLGAALLDGFPFGRATLTQRHQELLKVLAITLQDLLVDYPGGIISITGHTDAVGEPGFNDALGTERANAVMNFLADAGVPASAITTGSRGESQLSIKTDSAEPRNRRVAIRFITPSRSQPIALPPTPTGTSTDTSTTKVDLTYKGSIPGTIDCGTLTDCSASGGAGFEQQPKGLRSLIRRSFPDQSESQWFTNLDGGLRDALATIFNRLCKYHLLCYAQSITGMDPSEAPLKEIPFIHSLGAGFTLPGKTASVFFTTANPDSLLGALLATGQFCIAGGLGGSMHPGQTSLREISTSDSLHISLGPGNKFDAHIDKYSPVPDHPDGIFCPSDPTIAALTHIGRELVPEYARKYLGIPGFQFFPEPVVTQIPSPPEPSGQAAPPIIAGITLHGPVKLKPPKTPGISMLPDKTEALLAEAIPRFIRVDALTPPGVVQAVQAASKARENAGPDEEQSLITALDAARANMDSFADAQLFAIVMARLMGDAHRKGAPGFVIDLGILYKQIGAADNKYIIGQVLHIAKLIRALLGEQAAGIYKIWIQYGDIMQDFTF